MAHDNVPDKTSLDFDPQKAVKKIYDVKRTSFFIS